MHKLLSLSRTLTSSAVWGAFALCATALVSAPAMAQEAAATKAAPAKAEAKATAAPTAKATTTAAPKAEAKVASDTEAKAEGETEAAPADAATAPTDEQREEARLAFEAGNKSFEEGNYVDAARSFQKAHSIIPSPHAEYWIALSLDKGDTEGKNPAAVAHAYEIFLSNPGAGHVGATEVEQAKARLDELRKGLPAQVTVVTVPEGATVSINGQAQEGVTPITFEIPAGTYQVSVSLEGYDDTTVEVNAEGGIALEQQVNLNKSAPPPPPVVVATEAAPEPEKKSMVPAIVTLGLGGAGLISGTVFGIMALNSKSKFNDNPTSDRADAAERNALIADMSFGIALTLGITGIVLLTSGDETTATAKQTRGTKKEFAFAPYASPRGAGAAARLTF